MGKSNDALINDELTKIVTWLNCDKISINTTKTKYMFYYQPKKKVPKIHLLMKNNLLTTVDKFSYLVLIIDKQLKLNEHIQHIANKIAKTVGLLSRLKYTLPPPPPSVLKILYNTLMCSHLNYCLTLLFNLIGENIKQLSKIIKGQFV